MNFDHFITAQDPIYAEVVRELGAGRKTSHWMWFIFPQLAGLGTSDMSRRFAIDSLDTAGQYLNHPVLGPRLLECTRLVLQIPNRSAEQIFGAIDALKFRSSMTLFARAAPKEKSFTAALEKFFTNQQDPQTLHLLGQ